ncbi:MULTISPECIES: LysR family transcriptional regulator [Vagococcus]|uniref:Chromosome initiation inhibitor n=1 Tax=Vagococcus fluvialis bH819 TaxID=1255619 RepID=A0A1X6WPA7_9ENTE|nr:MULTISPECIES: LysR family transcriptional regulator [Vagococcus]SLM86144.1 Chromosome initiation inhibitor [Vagococcus fluvialis bH819]HCM90392.1 LysR family transcriptional regulator [Vagococcus sp.]
MELRVLNYFLTVVREKNISRAAEVLHVSQPTLSKQLNELETELGVTLFIRGNRYITLTESGVYLKKRSEEILSLVSQTESNLKINDIIGGTLSIGGGETILFKLIAEVVDELLAIYPDINTQLYSGNFDDISEKIDRGLLDFALVIDPVEKLKYESLQLPYSDTWGILVNKNHSLANKSYITANDLFNVPLFSSNQSLMNHQLYNWFGNKKNHLNITGHYNLLYNASLLSDVGNIAVLCIDGIINTAGTNLKFIELFPKMTSPVYLIWKKDVVLSNISNLFLKNLKIKIECLEKADKSYE